MAIIIPLITQYDGKGIARAKKEFAQLEGFGAKAGFILRKSMLPVGAALGAIGAAAFQAGDALLGMAQAAAEDQAEQKQLALTLQKTTKATDAQVASVEEYIDQTQRAYGVTDSKLRPAFARLVRSTKDVGQAQRLLNISMDIAATTGKDLSAVANAVGKAHDGQFTALGRLGLGLDQATLKSKDFEKIMGEVEKRTGGAAAAAADTYQGKIARLRIRFDEFKESIGTKLLPILDKLLNKLMVIADAFEEHGLAGAMLAAQEQFPAFVQAMSAVYDIIANTYNAAKRLTTGLQRIKDFLVTPIGDERPDRSWTALPSAAEIMAGFRSQVPTPVRSMPGTPGLAGPVAPGMTVGGKSLGGITRPNQNINVTVTSADPRAVVDALVKYNRQNGAIPVTVGR